MKNKTFMQCTENQTLIGLTDVGKRMKSEKINENDNDNLIVTSLLDAELPQ